MHADDENKGHPQCMHACSHQHTPVCEESHPSLSFVVPMQSPRGKEVSSTDFLAAEPDVLKGASAELVKLWNE